MWLNYYKCGDASVYIKKKKRKKKTHYDNKMENFQRKRSYT